MRWEGALGTLAGRAAALVVPRPHQRNAWLTAGSHSQTPSRCAGLAQLPPGDSAAVSLVPGTCVHWGGATAHPDTGDTRAAAAISQGAWQPLLCRPTAGEGTAQPSRNHGHGTVGGRARPPRQSASHERACVRGNEGCRTNLGAPQPREPGHEPWRWHRLQGRCGASGCGPGAAQGAAPAVGWTPESKVLAGAGREAAAPQCLRREPRWLWHRLCRSCRRGLSQRGRGCSSRSEGEGGSGQTEVGPRGCTPEPVPGAAPEDKPSASHVTPGNRRGSPFPLQAPWLPTVSPVPPHQRSAELPVVGGPGRPQPRSHLPLGAASWTWRREQSQGLRGLPGGNGNAGARSGFGGGGAGGGAAAGGSVKLWGAWWGCGGCVGLRGAVGAQPTPTAGWGLGVAAAMGTHSPWVPG